MSRSHHTRSAFTMIELLVVILIITILAALLLPALGKVRQAAKRSAAVNEIAQMGNAISAFKTKYRTNWMPSSITLREDMAYQNTAADQESLAYLKQLWPQIALPTPTSPVWIDWNGDGSQPPAGTAFTLEGDQCLVFFLGGIGRQGFSSNPRNPADATSLGGPFFEFPAARLAANGNTASAAGFLSFVDQWNGVPYIFYAYTYHSFPGLKSGYDPTHCPTVIATFNGGLSWSGPYKDTPSTYFSPRGYQVISAGADKVFGFGGQAPATGWDQGSPDGDNVTSFSGGQLSGQ